MSLYKTYLPEVKGIFLGLLALNIWYLSSLGVAEKVLPSNYIHAFQFLSTLAGAFVGAYSAFWLKQYESRKSEIKTQVESMNEALFVLARQINALENVIESMEKYNGPYERAFLMPAIKPPSYLGLTHDIRRLGYLITLQEPQMLLELTICQESFEQALDAVKIRNEFYVNELQPAMHRLDLLNKAIPVTDLEARLGKEIFSATRQAESSMQSNVYSSHEKLIDLSTRFLEMCRRLYPGHRFIKI